MADNNIIIFPDYNSPLSEEAKNRFDKLIADIERDSELYAAYISEGPDPNPLIRRYQVNLVNEFNENLEKYLYE